MGCEERNNVYTICSLQFKHIAKKVDLFSHFILFSLQSYVCQVCLYSIFEIMMGFYALI